MNVYPQKIEGCVVIEPEIHKDDRGVFFESFNAQILKDILHQNIDFVQDNQSVSAKGVLRGLHFQTGAFAQAKLVRVIKGRVQDVVVDLRPSSKTFGNYLSLEISEKNNKQLFIPRGCAHGFLALEDDTIFSYKCDNYYNKKSEAGIIYNDTDLNIVWRFLEGEMILSEKDKGLPSFKDTCY
jgi:dTDP-4-dehydrorhamnose 3,5-epimerase